MQWIHCEPKNPFNYCPEEVYNVKVSDKLHVEPPTALSAACVYFGQGWKLINF